LVGVLGTPMLGFVVVVMVVDAGVDVVRCHSRGGLSVCLIR